MTWSRHGFSYVLGVLTHQDLLKNVTKQCTTRKALKVLLADVVAACYEALLSEK